MKIVAYFAVFCLSISQPLLAQSDSSTTSEREIFLGAGYSYPYLPEEFKEIWKRGFNAEVGYGYSFSPGDIGYGAVFASIQFSRFPFDESGYRSRLLRQYPPENSSEITDGSIIARGSTKILAVLANFKGSFSPSKKSVAPYFLISAGFAHYSRDSIAIAGNSSYSVQANGESAFAWSFGIGCEIPVLEQYALFIQGRSVLGVFEVTRQFFPITAGVRLRF